MTTTSAQTAATITINGSSVPIEPVAAHTTALDWLRGRGLTGVKEGCAEGECGACSVMVARAGTGEEPTQWTALNSCLVPVAALDGQEVVTAEGLGSPEKLHPVQREMADRGGSQCGYCTPGFVCSMAAEYYREGRGCQSGPTVNGQMVNGSAVSNPTVATNRASTGDTGNTEDAEHGPNGFDLHALSGNLCRCTGYRPIRDAAYALGDPEHDDPFSTRRHSAAPVAVGTRVSVDGAEFVRATDLDSAVHTLAERPEARVLAGSTDWGVEVNIRGTRAPLVLAVDQVPELREFNFDSDSVRIGAGLSLSEIERRLDGRIPLLTQLFPQFASRLIRNGATIGGNLGTGSPIGDTPPALLALDATVVLSSIRGDREVTLADYFTGYRQSVRADDELIRAVVVPLPLAPITAFHKIAKRRFDDISSVAVGYAVNLTADSVIDQVRIGLGGVAATPLRATATEEALLGKIWNEQNVDAAAEVLTGEGTPMDDHRASARYRSAMLGQSLRRLYADNPHASGQINNAATKSSATKSPTTRSPTTRSTGSNNSEVTR